MNNKVKLVIALVVPQLAGIIGSIFTTPSIMGWYSMLVKPGINPPSWLLLPYIMWVSFAGYLNYLIYALN